MPDPAVPPLVGRMPSDPTPDALYDAFEAWTSEQGLNLYPAQDEALIELVDGANVILATPTGSGQEPGRRRRALRGAGPRPTQLLHRADQGAGVGEVLRALRHVRRRQRRHAHRRRRGQPDGADHRRDRRGARQLRRCARAPTPTSAWS